MVKVEENSTKKCPVCASNDTKVHSMAGDPDNLFDTRFVLLRCSLCDLVFLSEDVKIDNFYTRAYYRNVEPVMEPFFNIPLYFFILERIKLVRRYKRGVGKILDIGCGDGAFLLFMKEYGWQTFGIDSSASACDFMRSRNLAMLGEDFLTADIGEKSMDVITYWYSFEHLSNPIEYLRKTHKVLRDDGILVISVPNISSLQAIFSGNRWFHLDVPRHILHFSPSTLQNALLKADFEIMEVKHNSLQMNIFGWHQSLLNLLGCQQNFLYRCFKRGQIHYKKMLPSLLITLLASPFIFPVSLILSRLEESCKRGGIVNAIAKKRI